MIANLNASHIRNRDARFVEAVDEMIGAARRVEHYDIAAYSTVIKFAELLGEDEAAKLLEQTLDEETETDEKLVGLLDQFEVQGAEANSNAQEESDEDNTTPITQKKARSARA